MVCVRCGTFLPADANFCFKCGKPQKAAVQVQGDTPKYETCQITLSEEKGEVFSHTHTFWAKALGPQGTYTAGESPKFICSENSLMHADPILVQACNALIATLTQNGWEPITVMGDRWFAYRFRRRIYEPVHE